MQSNLSLEYPTEIKYGRCSNFVDVQVLASESSTSLALKS